MGYRQIPQHKGEIIQYFGDGCLALFGSAFEYALIKVDRDPTSPDGYIFMARLHQALGDSERAIAI
ncbi:MAG: hypothetical protein OEQ81_08585 [Flavobacteriaceae bacterium]|nr:hypothetical protein [Flavobacteriaceae bacterium]